MPYCCGNKVCMFITFILIMKVIKLHFIYNWYITPQIIISSIQIGPCLIEKPFIILICFFCRLIYSELSYTGQ